MGMQIKTYLPNAQAKAFDRLATKMEMSRYELALLAIQDFITKGDPKDEVAIANQDLPDLVPSGSHKRSKNSDSEETKSEPQETTASTPSTTKSTTPLTQNILRKLTSSAQS